VVALRKSDRLQEGWRRAFCWKLWTTSKVFISQENDLENRRWRNGRGICGLKSKEKRSWKRKRQNMKDKM
jgi:hypothetical protein